MTAQNFRWLPNALTIARMLLAVPVLLSAVNEHWAIAFWLFVAALLTDFLDGLAAKKLQAVTKFGTQLDRLADMTISSAGIISLAILGLFPWWAVPIGYGLAAFLAEERFFIPKHGPLHRIRPALSVAYLIIVWTMIGLVFLAGAYGWQWWYLPVILGAWALSASLKRHRLKAWLGISPKRD